MPRDFLHQLLGAGHPNRPRGRDLGRERRLLGLADTDPHFFLAVHLLEQLGDDEGDFQQATRPGMYNHPLGCFTRFFL